MLPIRAGGCEALDWSPKDSGDVQVAFSLYDSVVHSFLALLNIIDVFILVIELYNLYCG